MVRAKSERGAILSALRREAKARHGKLTQFQVAVATGLDTQTISLLELGKIETISRKSAQALAAFYSQQLGRKIKPEDLGYQIGRMRKEKEC